MNLNKISNEYFKLNQPDCMIVPTNPVPGLEGDYIEKNNQIISSLSRTKKTSVYCSGIKVLNPFKINSKYKKK